MNDDHVYYGVTKGVLGVRVDSSPSLLVLQPLRDQEIVDLLVADARRECQRVLPVVGVPLVCGMTERRAGAFLEVVRPEESSTGLLVQAGFVAKYEELYPLEIVVDDGKVKTAFAYNY